MSRLHDQHRRLYHCAEPGTVRALVVGLRQPADWSVLGALWRGVQADLDWPAPGIAVNGRDAIELWFSLAEPVPLPQAREALSGLVARYLTGVKPERLSLWPAAQPEGNAALLSRLPPQPVGPQCWSAFVAPDLAAVFADEPALDLPPGDDAQAELLSRLNSVSSMAWRSAWAQRAPAPQQQESSAHAPPTDPSIAPPATALTEVFEDPRDFLRAVMNDNRLPLDQRIDAAKALLGVAPPGR
jgi:hypothetical protein